MKGFINNNTRSKLIESHEERCETQGHEWENCLTASIPMHVYQECKWCSVTRTTRLAIIKDGEEDANIT